MFTGLITSLGKVVRADRRSDAQELTIAPQAWGTHDLLLGESIAHSGVCLTVTAIGAADFRVLAGAETLARTTLGQWRVGTMVNLERSLRMGDRLGGHWVAGHVDGTGRVSRRIDGGANLVLTVAAAPALLRYVVGKGSIAIEGVSLTVNAVDADSFSVAIIPHTRDATTLGRLHVGDPVNLEVDIIGKYVEKLTLGYQKESP
jgi:riboflavin synthase